MIRIFEPHEQSFQFYGIMGYWFSRPLKELEGRIYNTDNSVWFVAIDEEGYVVGFASIVVHKSFIKFDNLFVVDRARRKGIATKLLEVRLTYARENYEGKLIKTVIINPICTRLFEKYGFKKVGNNGRWLKYEKEN